MDVCNTLTKVDAVTEHTCMCVASKTVCRQKSMSVVLVCLDFLFLQDCNDSKTKARGFCGLHACLSPTDVSSRSFQLSYTGHGWLHKTEKCLFWMQVNCAVVCMVVYNEDCRVIWDGGWLGTRACSWAACSSSKQRLFVMCIRVPRFAGLSLGSLAPENQAVSQITSSSQITVVYSTTHVCC